jgi:serine/threonine-protein kinase
MLGATGPLPVWRAVDYVLQACEALGAAHAAGIVHRDIKPENLFVTTGLNGTPLLKVLDFGISKLTSDRARVEPGQGGEVTVAGELFGTPAYMSPEQLLTGDDVDGRTDVWAIGVVLYQLLSGRLPFDGESLPELCAAILNKHPVPLSDVRADVPALLARSVDRCLAKGRDERFQNVADLRFELAPFAVATREQRVSQALRTLDANDQGRPPTPLPDELLTRALRAAPVPTFEDDRWVATTASGVTSQMPSAVRPSQVPAAKPKAKPRRTKLLAFGAAGLVGAGLVIVAVTGATGEGGPDHSVTTEEPAAPAGAVVGPGAVAHVAVAVPVAPPVSVEPPVVPSAPETASAEPAPRPVAVKHVRAPAVAKDPGETVVTPPPSRPAKQPSSAASHGPPVDPNAVLNPFD